MKILLTGGAGFIGSHIADVLLLNGYEIVIVDNLSTGKIDNIKFLEDKFPNKIKFIQGDISEYEVFKKLNHRFSAIIHLAAIVSVPRSVHDPIETNQVTLGGAINVFEFARINNIKKIIQASSAAVYGDVKKYPVKEKDIGNFLSPYAISKYSCELYANYYDKAFAIKTISMRFFNVYGERQDPSSPYSGVISIFVNAFKNKSQINIFGDGKNTRDFIYVGDVANIILKLVEKKDVKTDVYNLGTGKQTSLLQLVRAMEKIFGYKVKVNFKEARVGDIKKSVANISKIQKHLKFQPKYSLVQGLSQMLK
jgi:UDP-glucose 4-epimerase